MLRIYLLFNVNIQNIVFIRDYWKNLSVSISELLTDQFSFPGNGGMNLGRHDKEFQFERMIGKINSEDGRRQHRLKIEISKYLDNPMKWKLLFAGQKYSIKSEKKFPSIRQAHT